MTIMKKTLILLSILIFGLTSCKKYLDVKPYDLTIPETAEEYSALLQRYLNKIDDGDDQVLIFNTSRTLDWELFADNFESALRGSKVQRLPYWVGYTQQTTNTLTYYKQLYEVIRDCNVVISGMSEDGSDVARNTFGAAYAMRALAYYQLLKLYSPAVQPGVDQLGVPLVKEFNMEARPPRASIQEVARSIEDDLKKAISYNVDDEDYLFTQDVAQGLLVRLYFWTEQWDKVVSSSKPLLDKYPLLSGDAYKDMLSSDTKKGNVLIKILKIINTGAVSTKLDELKYFPTSADFANLFPKEERERDIRYALSINGKRIAQKTVFSGFRIAEVHLMATEAYYHLGQDDQALSMLNALRAARITDATPLTKVDLSTLPTDRLITVDATGKSLTPLIRAILVERRKELFMEGDRFFELKRNGSPEFWKAHDGLKYTTKTFMYCYPIPPEDIIIQPDLIQNEGYPEYTIGMPKA